MSQNVKLLLLLDCGHTAMLWNHVPGAQVPLIQWCGPCDGPVTVSDHVSAARERGPDGKA